MSIFVLLNTKEDILRLLVPIDFHSMKNNKNNNNNTMEVNGDQKLSGYPHSLKYRILCLTDDRHSQRFRTTWG